MEIKDCPFCNHIAGIHGDSKLVYVQCIECLTITKGHKTEKEAIEAWNKRHADNQE